MMVDAVDEIYKKTVHQVRESIGLFGERRTRKTVFNVLNGKVAISEEGSLSKIVDCLSGNIELNMILLCATDLTKPIQKTCAKIRKRFTIFEMPILLICDQPVMFEKALSFGINDCLTSNISASEIIAKARFYTSLTKNICNLQHTIVDLTKQKRETNEHLKLQMRMTPHFLFNGLNTIHSLIETDAPRASRALVILADIYRFHMDFAHKTLIPLGLEWSFTYSYLTLINIRLGDKVRVKMKEDLPIGRDFMIPPFSLQPLVENALKHGLQRGNRPGAISIDALAKAGGIELVVINDGRRIRSKSTNSRSLGNILKRMEYFYSEVKMSLKGRIKGGAEARLFFAKPNSEVIFKATF